MIFGSLRAHRQRNDIGSDTNEMVCVMTAHAKLCKATATASDIARNTIYGHCSIIEQ